MFTIIYFQPIKTLNKNYIIYPLFCICRNNLLSICSPLFATKKEHIKAYVK